MRPAIAAFLFGLLGACQPGYDGPQMDDPAGQPLVRFVHQFCMNTDLDIERWDRKLTGEGWRPGALSVGINSSSGRWAGNAPDFGLADLTAYKRGMLYNVSPKNISWNLICEINLSLPRDHGTSGSDFAKAVMAVLAPHYGSDGFGQNPSFAVESYTSAIDFPGASEASLNLTPKGRRIRLWIFAEMDAAAETANQGRPANPLSGMPDVPAVRAGHSASAAELVEDFLAVCVAGDISARQMTERARDRDWIVKGYARRPPNEYSSHAVFNPPDFCDADLSVSEYTREDWQNGGLPLRTCQLDVSYYCRNQPDRKAHRIGRADLAEAIERAGFRVVEETSDNIAQTFILSHPQAGEGKRIEFGSRREADAGGWLKMQVPLQPAE